MEPFKLTVLLKNVYKQNIVRLTNDSAVIRMGISSEKIRRLRPLSVKAEVL
jgi:hypothetical protein